MTVAKAVAGAITAIGVYIVGEIGLDLPETVVAAAQLLVGLVVYQVSNTKPEFG